MELDESTLYSQILKFCLYRERSEKEVRTKLKEKGCTTQEIERVLKKLKEERFQDEKRFAHAFASDKARLQKWGKQRIRMELRNKGVEPDLILEVLADLPEDDYTERLREIAEKKWESLRKKDEDLRKSREKLRGFLMRKGYTWDEIEPHWKEITR